MNATQTRVKKNFDSQGVDNPFDGIGSKFAPYKRLASRLKGLSSYGHAHKVVKYGFYRNTITGQRIMELAEQIAEEIKKEVGQQSTSEIYQ